MGERTGVVEPTSPATDPTSPDRPAARSRLRRAASGTWAVVAVLVVWFALVVPNQLGYLGPRAASASRSRAWSCSASRWSCRRAHGG